jgi:hypothetical protein
MSHEHSATLIAIFVAGAVYGVFAIVLGAVKIKGFKKKLIKNSNNI